MTWNRRLVSLFTISLVVGLASIARAQVTTGTISGTVTDPNGAVVAGANVKATSLATDASLQFIAREGGRINVMKLIKLIYLLDRLSIQRRSVPLRGRSVERCSLVSCT